MNSFLQTWAILALFTLVVDYGTMLIIDGRDATTANIQHVIGTIGLPKYLATVVSADILFPPLGLLRAILLHTVLKDRKVFTRKR
jgi:hypothetical protein